MNKNGAFNFKDRQRLHQIKIIKKIKNDSMPAIKFQL